MRHSMLSQIDSAYAITRRTAAEDAALAAPRDRGYGVLFFALQRSGRNSME